MRDRVMICTGCEGGRELSRAAEAAGIKVARVACLNVCGSPVAVALREPGKIAYLFAGVSTDLTGELSRFLELYTLRGDGQIADARECEGLRHRLLGLMPDPSTADHK